MSETRIFTLSIGQRLVLSLLTALVVGLFIMVSSAQAADTITSSTYLDTNNDGSVDTVRWIFDENVTACTYEAGDWTVNTATTMTISVTGVTCTGADTILDINVSGDINETGAATDPVISYADAATAGSLTLTSGNMAAHASVTATDSAKPILHRVILFNSSLNKIVFKYSEDLRVSNDGGGDADLGTSQGSSTSATLGDMTTAKTFAGIATWDGSSDMTNNTAADSRIDVTVNSNELLISLNWNTVGYFASGTVGPGNDNYTVISDANDVADLSGNPVNSAQSTVLATGGGTWDVTKPTVSSITLGDADADGRVDKATVVFSESISDSSMKAADTTLGGGAGSFTTGTANDDTTVFNLTSDTLDVDTSATAADFLSSGATNKIRDSYGNTVNTATDGTIVSGDVTEADGAAPVVVSTSPADLATGVTVTSDVSITFSEAMNTTFIEGGEYSFSPDPGTFAAAAWTLSDTVVTLNPDSSLACNTSYTVTTAEAAIDAASGSPTGLATTGPLTGDLSFTTVCTSSSSSTAPTQPKTWSVMLDSPNGGESYMAGDKVAVNWTTGGTGQANYVNLSYSIDSGTSYTRIATNVQNKDTYLWTIPSGINSSDVAVLVETTDLVDTVAQDTSNQVFTIGTPSTVIAPVTPVVTEPETGNFAKSPVTGELEAISEVNAYDYISSPSFSAVYYIDADLNRHPFPDQQTFFTWNSSFSVVKTVTDATLTTLTIGTPILPRHGVVLVKIQSLNKVYALDFNGDDELSPKLRWITSEEVAEGLYGDNWADYVIDVQPTVFTRFSTGLDIDSIGGVSIDMSIMKTRAELNS